MNNDIITVQDSAPAISDDKIIQMAENAEKRIGAIKKIKEISLKVTNVNDWIDQQGRPYLQASGSSKVARVFGVSWRIDEPTYEEDEEGYRTYTFKGEFSLAGATIESLGVRSAKDPFFTTRYKDGHKTTLTGAEVDNGDVKKAALTNLLGNGVTTILGIRNMTWDEIKNVTGFTKEDVTNVQYKKTPKKDAAKKEPIREPKSTSQKPQDNSGSKQKEKEGDSTITRINYVRGAFTANKAIVEQVLKVHELKPDKTLEPELNKMSDESYLKLVHDIEFALNKAEKEAVEGEE